jgi:electron transport complex protein RnfC
MMMDYISEKCAAPVNRSKYHALVGEATIAGKRVLLMKPQTFMNLSGDAVREAAAFYKIEPKNIIVPLGTSALDVLNFAGGLTQANCKVIMGGPMMGTAVPNLDVPVIKGTSGVLVLDEKKAWLEKETACVRCSKCLYVCPMKLQPNLLDLSARNDDFENLNKLNVMDCIECGSCAYVCPSRRRQVQQIKVAKVKMRNAQTKAK